MRMLVGLLLGTIAVFPAVTLAADPAGNLTARVDAAIVSAADGKDVDGLRVWVRESVRPEIYDGVLKGPRGALLSASANSADQALLLERMIRHAAPDAVTRFAACAPAESVFVPADIAELQFDLAALANDVEDAGLKSAIAEFASARTDIRDVAQAQARWISAALDQASSPQRDGTVTMRHVWLQVQDGTNWRDLDTTTSEGAPPCAMTDSWDDLPETLYHTVKVGVVVERRADGQAVTGTALERQLRIADIATAEIAAGFGETMGLVDRRIDAETGRVVYTPVLRVDGEAVMGDPVLLPIIPETVGKAVAGAVGGVIGAFGGDDESAAAQDESLSGVWLAFELNGPDGAQSYTSMIVDRVGFAARRDGQAATAPLKPLDHVPGDYAAFAAFWQIGVLTGGQVVDLSLGQYDLDTLAGFSGALDELLRLFPAMHRDFGAVAAPGASILIAGLEPVADEGFKLTLDAVRVPGISRNVEEAGADAAALLAAEAMFVALVGGEPKLAADARAVLETARGAGIPLTRFAPGETVRVPGASRDALGRMQAWLDDGYAVVAPAEAPRIEQERVLAWLVVDANTGTVRDQHESGRHAAAVEYQANVSRSLSTWERFRRVSCSVMRPVVVVGALIYGASGGAVGGEVLKVVAKTAMAAEETRRRGEAAQKIACMGSGGGGPSP